MPGPSDRDSFVAQQRSLRRRDLLEGFLRSRPSELKDADTEKLGVLLAHLDQVALEPILEDAADRDPIADPVARFLDQQRVESVGTLYPVKLQPQGSGMVFGSATVLAPDEHFTHDGWSLFPRYDLAFLPAGGSITATSRGDRLFLGFDFPGQDTVSFTGETARRFWTLFADCEPGEEGALLADRLRTRRWRRVGPGSEDAGGEPVGIPLDTLRQSRQWRPSHADRRFLELPLAWLDGWQRAGPEEAEEAGSEPPLFWLSLRWDDAASAHRDARKLQSVLRLDRALFGDRYTQSLSWDVLAESMEGRTLHLKCPDLLKKLPHREQGIRVVSVRDRDGYTYRDARDAAGPHVYRLERVVSQDSARHIARLHFQRRTEIARLVVEYFPRCPARQLLEIWRGERQTFLSADRLPLTVTVEPSQIGDGDATAARDLFRSLHRGDACLTRHEVESAIRTFPLLELRHWLDPARQVEFEARFGRFGGAGLVPSTRIRVPLRSGHPLTELDRLSLRRELGLYLAARSGLGVRVEVEID